MYLVKLARDLTRVLGPQNVAEEIPLLQGDTVKEEDVDLEAQYNDSIKINYSPTSEEAVSFRPQCDKRFTRGKKPGFRDRHVALQWPRLVALIGWKSSTSTKRWRTLSLCQKFPQLIELHMDTQNGALDAAIWRWMLSHYDSHNFFRTVSNENLKTCDIVAADIANSAKQMWDSFHSLMLGAPPLKLSRGLQGSTFLLGHRKEASGIRPRPQIANAAMVIPQAVALLEDRSNYQAKLEVSWSDDFLLPKVRWDEAKKRLKKSDWSWLSFTFMPRTHAHPHWTMVSAFSFGGRSALQDKGNREI